MLGLALLSLTWLVRQRRWLVDAFKSRRGGGPDRQKEEVPS